MLFCFVVGTVVDRKTATESFEVGNYVILSLYQIANAEYLKRDSLNNDNNTFLK